MKTIIRFLSLFAATSLLAQAPPLATGLRAPARIAFTHQGNLIVTEQGGAAPNTGRISLIDRTTGVRKTLVDGLPSAVFTGAEPAAPSGPAGLALQGQTLYVTIGSGDATIAGPAPGSEQPNPSGPASPILASILALKPSRSLDTTTGDFFLQPAQHAAIKGGATVTLRNSAGEQLDVALVIDLPDYISSPRPDYPANVKNSNPFSAVVRGNAMFVADAAHNLLRRIDLNDGTTTVLTSFPLIPSPSPLGPPMIEAVPDGVRLRGNDLLVTTLTGFPFPAGSAGVYSIDIGSGAMTQIATGLTSAVDLEPLGGSPSSPVLVVEFSTNMLAAAPGRVRVIRPGQAPVVVAENLITPTGVAVDRRTGEIFVTLIALGSVARIDAANVIPPQPSAVVAGAAATAGARGSRWTTQALMHNPNPFAISGRIIFHPQGVSGTASDPSLAYVLAPHETKAFTDLVAAAGGSGMGSLDIVAAVGGPPVMTVGIVDEASVAKPAAMMPVQDPATALVSGFTGTLLTPSDVAGQRFNVGIRTLGEGATIVVTLRNTEGSTIRTTTVTYPPNYSVQLGADQLMQTTVGARNSLTFEVQQGSAFVYGAAIQNDGSGVLVQSASPIVAQ